MKYSVIVMPSAQDDLDKAYAWLVLRKPQHASTWYNGLLDCLYSLEESPARCPVAPESQDSPDEIRQMLYGDKRHAYRILFSIDGDHVLVLHIRHGAMKNL
jgi:plasmid stabilization system protein ParE